MPTTLLSLPPSLLRMMNRAAVRITVRTTTMAGMITPQIMTGDMVRTATTGITAVAGTAETISTITTMFSIDL